MNPIDFIREIRESQPELQIRIFTKGSCYRFFKILKLVFPEAEPFYDSNHVLTKIGDKFYDITGEVEATEFHSPMRCFSQATHDFFATHFYGHDTPQEILNDPINRALNAEKGHSN